MTWVLILVIAHSEGPAVTSVPGFATLQQCEAAGRAAAKAWSDTGVFSRTAPYVCAEQGVPK